MEIPARRDACNANASQRQRRTESRRFAHPALILVGTIKNMKIMTVFDL